MSKIRRHSLYTQQCYMSYRFPYSLREGFPSWSCSQGFSKHVWHIALLCVQWKPLDDKTEVQSVTLRIFIPRKIGEFIPSIWFYNTNLLRCTVTWTSTYSVQCSNVFSFTNNMVSIFPSSVCFPMPQLTPDFDRVIIYALSPDATHFNNSNYYKEMLLVQEVRISEDYCHSDIIIVDLANYTLGHVPKVSFTDLKKYELCVLVSALVIRILC